MWMTYVGFPLPRPPPPRHPRVAPATLFHFVGLLCFCERLSMHSGPSKGGGGVVVTCAYFQFQKLYFLTTINVFYLLLHYEMFRCTAHTLLKQPTLH
jgi:hypothetical protein